MAKLPYVLESPKFDTSLGKKKRPPVGLSPRLECRAKQSAGDGSENGKVDAG